MYDIFRLRKGCNESSQNFGGLTSSNDFTMASLAAKSINKRVLKESTTNKFGKEVRNRHWTFNI